MALQKNVTLQDNFGQDVSFPNVYIRIDAINGGKHGMVIETSTYKEANGRLLVSNHYNFVPSLDGVNFISQAYNYLKTLPEFSDAEDV